VPDFKQPTTSRPPFDPDEYAKSADSALDVASDHRPTTQLAPPPLNRRVSMAVPPGDLAWFDLSAAAMALAERIDGTTTLLEMMESVRAPDVLRALAELHDARVLVYEKK
jgi:hypothetical protein